MVDPHARARGVLSRGGKRVTIIGEPDGYDVKDASWSTAVCCRVCGWIVCMLGVAACSLLTLFLSALTTCFIFRPSHFTNICKTRGLSSRGGREVTLVVTSLHSASSAMITESSKKCCCDKFVFSANGMRRTERNMCCVSRTPRLF